MFIGKLLIATGLCFQAYLLLTNQVRALEFDGGVSRVLASYDYLSPDSSQLLRNHFRLIIVALLSSSGLMIFTRNLLIKFLVLLGYLLLSYCYNHPLTQLPPISEMGFYENLAIIGGLTYLMGADWPLPRSSKVRQSKAKPRRK